MLRYLNCFDCPSGNLLVCDPFSTDINAEHYQLATANSCHICLPASKGMWQAYHVTNKNGVPYAIYLHHSSISPSKNVEQFGDWNCLGKVCVAFGHMVCIVDKVGYNKRCSTYLSYAEDAIYDVDSIFDWLLTSELPEFKKDYFKHKLISYHNNEFISGKDLYDIFKDTNIGGLSNIWSIDCKYRLHNTIKCAPIMDGIVSAAELFSSCYCPTINDTDDAKEFVILIRDHIPRDDNIQYIYSN